MNFFACLFFSCIIGVLTSTSPLFAANYGDSFIITMYDAKVKVQPPPTRVGNPFIILENKTLTHLIANVVNSKGEIYKVISLAPEKNVTVDLKVPASERLFLVPLSPPSQEIELIFGQKAYEIPEKK